MEATVVKAGRNENYLLVEGDEDEHVFTQLLVQHQVFEKFKIKDESLVIKSHNGIKNLLNERVLRNYLVIDESRRYGIVIDADEDLAARWTQIKSICEAIGYHHVPSSPSPDGTFLSEEGLASVSKACIHTWLAWQKDPGTSLGMSINKHYVDANALHAQQFISWIRKFFDLEST